MNKTFTSNQVKHSDQWTVKRDGNSFAATLKVFVINSGLLAVAIAVAYAIVK